MQEEVTQRTVALCVEATKLSAGMLQQAMKKVLDGMQKGVTGHKTYVFEIDSKGCGLIIDYHCTDWYNNENLYIHKALVYNSVSLFKLIDNLESITFNFSGSSYTITREAIEKQYPVDQKINDNEFVCEMMKLFETKEL